MKSIGGKNGSRSYVLERQIGKGSFGVVYSSPPYAIKQVFTNLTNKKVIIEQANILMRLNHPNIVRLFQILEQGNYVYMVMQHCDMDLGQYRLKHRINERDALHILKQVVEGLRYLLGQGLIHRDLKPANILYSQQQGKFKIADFGMAKYVDNNEEALLQTYAGTPLYMAPQLLCHRNYSTKCDIWSTGIIFYELVCGTHPWPSTSIGELHSKIKNIPKSIPSYLSQLSRELIDGMLKVQEKERMSWEELFQMILVNRPRVSNRVVSDRKISLSSESRNRQKSNESKSNEVSNRPTLLALKSQTSKLRDLLFLDLQQKLDQQCAKKMAYDKVYTATVDECAILKQTLTFYTAELQDWFRRELGCLRNK